MSMQIGRNSKITIAGTEVMEITGITITNAAEPVKVKTLSSTHTQIIGHTILDVAGTINMIEDLDDAGQTVIRNKCIDGGGTLVSGVQYYPSEDYYWESDLVTDTDSGCDFTNYAQDSSDGDTPVTCTVNFSFSGATQLTSV